MVRPCPRVRATNPRHRGRREALAGWGACADATRRARTPTTWSRSSRWSSAPSRRSSRAGTSRRPRTCTPCSSGRRGASPTSRRGAGCRWPGGGWCRPGRRTPSIGNRMINARMETVAEKPAFKKAFAKRRALLPADGYFEWYGEVKGKKQPFFIRPADGGVLAMAGLYELWRDPSVPADADDRPVAVDGDRAHHHGHRRPRPDPRPDAAAGREAAVRRVAGPCGRRPGRAARPAGAGRTGPADGVPRRHDRQQREEQRSRAGRPAARRGRPVRRRRPRQDAARAVDEPRCSERGRPGAVETIATPVGDARVDVSTAVDRWATLVLGHGAGGGIGAADLVALANRLPAHGIEVRPGRAALGRWPGARWPRRRRRWTGPGWRCSSTCRSTARCSWAAGRPGPGSPAVRRARSGAHGVLCLAFPLHPPGRPEKSRLAELDLPAAAGLPTLVLQGTRDAFGGPRRHPGRTRARWWCPSRVATTPCGCAKAAGGLPARAGGRGDPAVGPAGGGRLTGRGILVVRRRLTRTCQP